MATVYRAHDKRLGRDVAVKVIHPHLRDSREVAHRFSVEAQAVAKLRHPNIVEVFDVIGRGRGASSTSSSSSCAGRRSASSFSERGALPPEIAAAIALELLARARARPRQRRRPSRRQAGERPHRAPAAPGLGRRERSTPAPTSPSPRSPVGGDGGAKQRRVVKLTDFGIAKLLDAQGVTSTGQVLGSPAHMAPEQIEGGEVDARADVFGLGVLLYECMVGHLPFEGNNPAQVLRRVLDGTYPQAERERPTVGKRWSDLLDRALAHEAGGPLHRRRRRCARRSSPSSRASASRSPRRELEAWFDDPDGWTRRRTKRG